MGEDAGGPRPERPRFMPYNHRGQGQPRLVLIKQLDAERKFLVRLEKPPTAWFCTTMAWLSRKEASK